jgi:hypothetical protein
MKDKLYKIIQKAEEKGVDFCEWQYKNTSIPLYGLMEGNIRELIKTNYYKLLLLDRNFVQAYFGREWTIHLSHIVLENDFVEYYWRHLE